MKKYSKFEQAVLGLTAMVLLLMGGVYAAQRLSSAEGWQVYIERSDAPAAASASSKEEGRPDSLLEDEVIDLNTASQADLERLPGIGPGRAQAIVDYRKEHGPFGSVEELTGVSGIGSGILEQVRPYVTVE